MTASILSGVLSELHKLPPVLVYGLVALLVFGEAAMFIGFVLPGETAVLVAGAIASQGRVNIVVLCTMVAIAAIVGDSVGYIVGRRYGERLFGLPVIRHRRAALESALEGLRRRGPLYVFLARFSAFLRAVMPGLAGMSKMHYRRFFFANAAGGLLWGVGFTLIGYLAGNALHTVEKYASWGAGALLVVLIGVLVSVHLAKRRRERRQEAVDSRL
jgi:membrane protein DedA with SNARE-associated domain